MRWSTFYFPFGFLDFTNGGLYALYDILKSYVNNFICLHRELVLLGLWCQYVPGLRALGIATSLGFIRPWIYAVRIIDSELVTLFARQKRHVNHRANDPEELPAGDSTPLVHL